MSEWDFGISVYGLQIGIQLTSKEFSDLLLDHLPPGWCFASPQGAVRSYKLQIADKGGNHRLYMDGDLLYFHAGIEEILRWFEADLQMYVAEMCQDLVFVHAGVVDWKGQGIVIPGRSYSGKTTLIRSFLNAGAVYYSDEYAVFDRDGKILPYARPLGIRSSDGTRNRTTVESLEAVSGTGPLSASLIVATTFTAGAAWKPRRLTDGCALLVLFANTVSARRNPELALSTLRKAISGALVLESSRGESDEVVDLILNELGQETEEYATQREKKRAASSGTRA